MRSVIVLLSVVSIGACAAPMRLDPSLERIVGASEHFELAGPGAPAASLKHAESAYALYHDLLGVSPSMSRLVFVNDQAAFDAAVPRAAGAQGVYLRGDPPAVVTFPQHDDRVLRHEIAHHFIVALLGDDLPAWLNEGIAEVLEGAELRDGRPHVPVVSPDHLDRLLDAGVVTLAPSRSTARHAHVDYAAAWSLVAFHLERWPGSLRDGLLALGRLRHADPRTLLPTAREVLRASRKWTHEMESMLEGRDPELRAAAARVLGRLGELAALRRAWETERWWAVRLAIAGALARNGDKAAVRSILALVDCPALPDISRSAGQAFGTVAALKAWAAR